MHRKHFQLLIAIVVLLSLSITPVAPFASTGQRASAAARSNNDFLFNQPTDQIIIKYRDSASTGPQALRPDSPNTLSRLSSAAGMKLSYYRAMSGDAHVIKLEKSLPVDQVEEIVKSLSALPEVEYAQPDAFNYHTMVPNDTGYSKQWDLTAPTSSSYGINAPAAWDITTGSANIVVAVIDTGIRNHADLVGRTVPGYDFISNTYMGNDGSGRDSDPSDPGDWMEVGDCGGMITAFTASSWHGTHVAGTIGASANNGLGISGINWKSKILPVRVLGKCGGMDSDIIDGTRWAAGLPVAGVPSNANPAKVLNLSLTNSNPCSNKPAWQAAINEANALGATVVVAAGNNNKNALGYTPASCNGVISVAATDRYGDRASYSNYGSVVEIAAPGGDVMAAPQGVDGILSTVNYGTRGPSTDAYAFYDGTSMAAPHVAGVVSLMYSTHPNLNSTQVLSYLQSTVTAFPGGSSCNTSICGSGILNAYAALRKLNSMSLVAVLYIKVEGQTSNQFTGKITYQGSGVATQPVELRYQPDSSSAWSTYDTTSTDAAGNYTFTNVPELTGDERYYVRWQNGAQNTAYLSSWYCNIVTASGGNQVCNFDIKNVTHAAPAAGAAINLPYTFQWNRRSITSDQYALSFYEYDGSNFYPSYDSPLVGYAGQWTMMSLPSNMYISTQYVWEINVVGSNGYGTSYYIWGVTFNDTSSPQGTITVLPNQMHEDREVTQPGK